jgi:hypothetical protein
LCLLPAASRASELADFTGFTRPGSPGDTVSGDKVVPAATDAESRRTALGGTVYFTVLERSGNASDDPWGTGLPDFVKSFRPGVDFSGKSSNALDTGAKYLYLYQVVNDRHTAVPIQSAAVKLLVELQDLSSWGAFEGVGFATSAPAKGDKDRPRIRPVSFSNIVAASALEKAYMQEAPPVVSGPQLRLVPVPTERGAAAPPKGPNPFATLVWDALDPAVRPREVMLLAGSDFRGSPSVRAIWGTAGLPRDSRSTVFGFTSNLPPTLEPVRLRATRVDAKGLEIRPAAIAPADPTDPEPGGIMATGQAPTPRPESPTVPPLVPPAAGTGPPPPPPPPPLGPMSSPAAAAPAAGGSGGAPAGSGVGLVATAPLTGSGGGSGSGSGSGRTSTATQTTSGPSQQAQRNQVALPPITITNVAIAQQRQRQLQRQQQRQGHGHGSAVVPEPAGILLAALGLPFIMWSLRRRGMAAAN